MEYILTDADWLELGYMDDSISLDVDIGDTNDFELKYDKSSIQIKKGCTFFVPGTEYGGIIEEIETSTSGTEAICRGYTWRGLLQQIIIEPPAGQAYLTVSGDANRILEQVLNQGAGLYFIVPEENAGIQIKSYQFRYVDALSGLSAMLAEVGARLDIKAKEGAQGEACQVVIRAVPIRDYSEELQYDGDDNVSVTVRDYSRGINHLICLGTGELENRMVRHLYIQLDGSVGRKRYYKGTNERTAVYDYSSVSDAEELIKGGTERLKELASYKQAEMTIGDEASLEIGDIVSARDRDVGLLLSKPVINKILKVENGTETIEYKVKGED